MADMSDACLRAVRRWEELVGRTRVVMCVRRRRVRVWRVWLRE